VGAGGALAAQLALRALELPPGPRTGYLLVATLLAVAVLEHLLLVLPLRSSALWRWAMRRSARDAVVEAGVEAEVAARLAAQMAKVSAAKMSAATVTSQATSKAGAP
jgi:hypothetical protein